VARRIAADETAVAQARAAAASSGEWSAVSERPTTGDFVLLWVSKNDLSAGDICEVMQDDEDNTPYKLKRVGTSSVKWYFCEPDIQKILYGGRAHSSSGGPGALATAVAGEAGAYHTRGGCGALLFAFTTICAAPIIITAIAYRPAVLFKAASRALNLPVVMLRKLPVVLMYGMGLKWVRRLHTGWGWTTSRQLGRPTTGDFVRLKVNKNGLSAGDICEVMQDDRDSSPYKLKKARTSSVKQYFDESGVQNVKMQPANTQHMALLLAVDVAAVVVSLIAARVATNEAASKALLSALSNPQKLPVVLFKAALITLKLPVVMLRKLLVVLMLTNEVGLLDVRGNL
jgi:hypothetical protein